MTRRSRLEAFLDARIRAGDFPGAVWAVGDARGVIETGARGLRAVGGSPADAEPATEDTIYDLASLTKPVATAALAVLLQREGRLDLDEPAGRLLPELRGTDTAGISLRELGCHTSGLPAWLPLYVNAPAAPAGEARGGGMPAYLRRIAAEPLEAPVGQRAVYSCCGYILLGEAVARAAGRPLDTFFRERIASPLGLETLGYRPAAALRGRIAPTETGNAHERRMVAERGLDYDGWRTRPIRGDVHDGNAWGLGGVSGNAGLFGTAADVANYARELLASGPGRLFTDEERALQRTPRPSEGEVRSFGWQLAATPGCSAEGVLPPGAFGHTGFTGVCLWVDPSRGRSFVLLTNRVHPEVRNVEMNSARREFLRLATNED